MRAVAALSTKLSTAALDKHPQSKERGITLDLGFSSFTVPMPERLSSTLRCQELQFTLVDCPGHASLIRTIIGGAQIIDLMLLVIDVTKGIQVCLELSCSPVLTLRRSLTGTLRKNNDNFEGLHVNACSMSLQGRKCMFLEYAFAAELYLRLWSVSQCRLRQRSAWWSGR